MLLRITPLWVDADDGATEVRISLSGNGRAAWSEVLCYPEHFLPFAQELQNFPASVTSEVTLKFGDRGGPYAHHLQLRAFVRDGVGHCAVEIIAETWGDPLETSAFHFATAAEAAELNELGSRLATWVDTPTGEFVFGEVGG